MGFPRALLFGLCPLAILPIAGCGSTSKSRPQPVENVELLRRHAADLERAERMFLAGDAGYPAERDRLGQVAPGLEAWLAKSIVGHAVQSFDRLPAQWRPIERLRRLEQSQEHRDGLLFRSRKELAELGAAGAEAVTRYLLRDRRAQLRSLGRYLLEAQPPTDRLAVVRAELASGTPKSRVEALRMLERLPDLEGAVEALLEQAMGAADWRLRGTAYRVYAVRAKRLAGAAARRDPARDTKLVSLLMDRAKADPDAWVRRQGLLALGDLGAIEAVRPLIGELERLVAKQRVDEANAAAQALESLTGRRFGLSAQRWRQWLDGREV